MESSQSGLLERLRAQRESMQAAASQALPIEEEPPGMAEAMGAVPQMVPVAAAAAASAEAIAAVRDHAVRLVKLESEADVVRQHLDSVEANLRQGLVELRAEIPNLISTEVQRQTTTTNEAVADVVGRVGRLEGDFTRERERWGTLVTNFDQRLDHRLRSFRQDVTVMLAGMAVLVLAMLMLLLMRR
jgi:hypothetical protein